MPITKVVKRASPKKNNMLDQIKSILDRTGVSRKTFTRRELPNGYSVSETEDTYENPFYGRGGY